ncbi:MAG TPA: type II CAAX endopeptidase family protein [Myxococcaceae bacterium]|nr:type II CAAX endopeptidase family protein [Myxococcaceae bacterium]
MLDPRPPVSPSRLSWLTVAGCLLAMCFGYVLQAVSLPVGLWFTEVLGLLGVAWALTRWSGRAPARYARLRWPGAPAVLFAAALAVANYFGLAIPIEGLSRGLFPAEWAEGLDPTRAFLQLAPVDLWLTAAAAVLGAAFCEEFVFRGVVQRGFAAEGAHPAQAVVRAALLFALFHFNPVNFAALLEIGVFLGLVFLRTGSLVPGIVAHATQNAMVLGLIFWERDTAPSAGEAGWRAYVGLGGMGLVVLVMLLLLARRFPAVWGRPHPEHPEQPRLPLARAFAPWLVGASLLLLTWEVVDRRGVELGVVDMRVQLPAPRGEETEDVRSARKQLEVLRQRVRRGQAPLAEYVGARRALAHSLGDGTPTLQRGN